MKKTKYFLATLAALVTALASSCGSAPTATQQAAPPSVAQPTVIAPLPLEPPTQPAPAAPSFAPACPPAAACSAPAATDVAAINTYCSEKVPYQNIFLDPGTAFEPVDASGELKCKDSGTVVKGKRVISCTGKPLWTYELKLTNIACGATHLATGTGQCQEGFGYDAAQSCCVPVNAANNASVTVKVNIGACP